MRRLLFIGAIAAALTGCKVGPNYKRPAINAPQVHRGDPAPTPTPTSFGDEKWFNVFNDPKLQELIRKALVENYDVKIAAARVLEGQAIVTSTKAQLFPEIGASGGINRQRGPGGGINQDNVVGGLSWEIDFWGRVRRATEAARAELLSVEYNQKTVYQTLVSNIARAYFALRALDQQLEVARQSVRSREQSLKLVTARMEGGVGTRLDVDQAMSLVATARALIASLENQIEQTENLISVLIGSNPGPIARGETLMAQKMPPEVPAGLPSTLLERRPDIQEIEQLLIASNARIGVAKAAFFPTVTLTGSGGFQSFKISDLAKNSGGVWGYGINADLPIFDAGRRLGNYRAAQARQQQALFSYQRTIQDAFRDVADSLINYRKAKEFRTQQELLATTLRDQNGLANLRFTGGVSSYLEVLDTERQLLDAERQLADAVRDELNSVVSLYRSLGGGWKLE